MQFRFFGIPTVQDDDGAPRSVPSQTVLHLLAYLWLHRDEAQLREHLVGLFWPESDASAAQANLRSGLHYLRQALGGKDAAEAFLEVDRAKIRYRSNAPVWVDVAAFESALRPLEGEDAEGRAQRLEAACQLYRGPFLQGGYDDWILRERDRLRDRYLEALAQLIEALGQSRAYRRALEWSERYLQEQPLAEGIYCQRMALLYATGQRDTALREYERCRSQMADELGVDPSEATETLRQRIADEADLSELTELVGWPIEPPHTLPEPAAPFVGRRAELEAIQADLRGERLVNLTGMGGSGKTRLALEIARSDRRSFDEGVWFVDLSSVSTGTHLPRAIADALGVEADDSAPLDVVASWIGSEQILLMLDNAEHLLESCAHAVQYLLAQCPQLHALVTSRERLGLVDEAVRTVSPLGLPEAPTPEAVREAEASRLFIVRAGISRVTDANASWIAHLCEQLAGLPLAIELAAAWAHMLPVAEVAREIASHLDTLHSDEESMPPRQRSLKAAFEHSYALLTDEERDAFERLAVFRGPFDRRAAERVAGATLRTLGSLADKSLLQFAEPGEYGMHNLLQQYALARLGQDAERHRQTFRAHGECFAELVELWTPELQGERQVEALDAIQGAFDDIRLMWETARQEAEWTWMDRSLHGLYLFCTLRNRFWEATQLFEAALSAFEPVQAQSDVERIMGRAQARLGVPSQYMGQTERAERSLRNALTIARRHEDRAETCFALNELGRLLANNDPESARAYHQEALSIHREIGTRKSIATTLHNLANVELSSGNLNESRHLFSESYSLEEELNDQHGMATSLNSLGIIEASQGKLGKGRELFEQSLDVFCDIDDKQGIAQSLNNLGSVEYLQGNLKSSQNRFEESLARCRELGHNDGIARNLHNLGNVEREQGQLASSRKRFDEALLMRRDMGDQRGMASSLSGLAAVLQASDGDKLAAQLQGCITSHLAKIGTVLDADDQDIYTSTASALFKTLGKDAYTEAFESGQALSIEEAIALATKADPCSVA